MLISVQTQVKAQRSLEFLTIGGNAKQLALSEATTAIPIDGLNALVNPATLSGISQSMMSANYTVWGVEDTEISSFSAVLKEAQQTLSFSLLSNSIGNIEPRTNPGPSASPVTVDYLALTAAYAYDFGLFSLGTSLSYINEQYVINNANGYSFGLGAYSSLYKNKIRLGASLNHFGEMSKLNAVASKLPTQARIGVDADIFSISVPGDLSFPVLFSTTVDYTRYLEPLDLTQNDANIIKQDQSMFVGLRVFAAELISIQSGYRFLSESNRSWSAGLGVYHGDFKFDFAFIPFESGFNNGYSLGMRYQF